MTVRADHAARNRGYKASPALLRPQFGLHRLDWGTSVEFNLPHGEMFRLLRSHRFEVDDLI